MKKKLKQFAVTVDTFTEERTRVNKTVHFVTDGCKYYFNAQHHLLELERGQRALFDYLCEVMDARNAYMFNRELKTKFQERVDRFSSKRRSYATGSLEQYIQVLVSLGLVLDTGKKAYYIVNPKYAYKGSETSRKVYLKKLIESRIEAGLSVEKLIDVPIEQFFETPR